jgi:predicted alpha/beta-fold hydrolase
MKCHVCYLNPIILANSITQMRKGIISYFKTNEINNLKKHVDANHDMLAKKFDEEVNSYVKTNVVKQLVFF